MQEQFINHFIEKQRNLISEFQTRILVLETEAHFKTAEYEALQKAHAELAAVSETQAEESRVALQSTLKNLEETLETLENTKDLLRSKTDQYDSICESFGRQTLELDHLKEAARDEKQRYEQVTANMKVLHEELRAKNAELANKDELLEIARVNARELEAVISRGLKEVDALHEEIQEKQVLFESVIKEKDRELLNLLDKLKKAEHFKHDPKRK